MVALCCRSAHIEPLVDHGNRCGSNRSSLHMVGQFDGHYTFVLCVKTRRSFWLASSRSNQIINVNKASLFVCISMAHDTASSLSTGIIQF